ncbi:hypothetical protein SDC9_53822 [bioreactor metagenome]|uniref:Uncharacterized protein n=1 Tax=bioreactor metagenome TaxID=1076179 RepID=A0A644WUB7_9ZZZZ
MIVGIDPQESKVTSMPGPFVIVCVSSKFPNCKRRCCNHSYIPVNGIHVHDILTVPKQGLHPDFVSCPFCFPLGYPFAIIVDLVLQLSAR